ncbi:MAG: diguanylate cyclase, partial [Acidaminobacteraceae bacterium]
MSRNINTGNNKKIIALLTSISTLIVLLSLTIVLLFNYSNQLQDDSEYKMSISYYSLIDKIQDFTNQNVSLISGFSAFIQTTDVYTDEKIYTYLDYLLKDHLDEIRNIGILQDTTIMWNYPLKGNESAIGIDFSKVPEQADSIRRVKENLETLFVGPVNLVQGGIGFIIRKPLMKNGDYWGMVSIVLKAEQAFGFIENYSEIYNVDYLITHADQPDDIIYGNGEILQMSPLKFRTEDALGGWDIYTVPKGGWKNYSSIFVSIFIVSSFIYIIISISIYRWINDYNLVLKDKRELEKKYILDRFTGIYTREYFNMRVKEEFSHAARVGYSISMIYFDLDHFKNVNDTYGHSTGDKVLLNVVDIVKTIIRTEDVFSRWGGDEFILLLPRTELKEAANISERIRMEIENLEISRSLNVTASLGCSEWKKSEYMGSWFSRTDKALYMSKKTGKNKVTISNHESEKDILIKVKWDNAWNCGNTIIDQEHKKILDTCNSIIESSLVKSSFNETIRNIGIFLEEIEEHFSNEIAILKKNDYPYVNEH